jgi:hypothetical protein
MPSAPPTQFWAGRATASRSDRRDLSVIVIDEYLAVRVLRAGYPAVLPDDELVLTAARHWRLLQAFHGGRGGQLFQLFAGASPAVAAAIRWPHPEVLQVLDPRPLLDEAAAIAARFGGTGLIVAETLAAGLAHGRQLWFGTPANVGRLLERAAGELGVTVHIAP